MAPYNFYSAPLSGGMISGISSAHIVLFAANGEGIPVPIDIMVFVGTGSWSPLGGHTLLVPADTGTSTLLTSAFTILSHDVVAGEVIRLEIMAGPGATFYWGGKFGESRITIP